MGALDDELPGRPRSSGRDTDPSRSSGHRRSLSADKAATLVAGQAKHPGTLRTVSQLGAPTEAQSPRRTLTASSTYELLKRVVESQPSRALASPAVDRAALVVTWAIGGARQGQDSLTGPERPKWPSSSTRRAEASGCPAQSVRGDSDSPSPTLVDNPSHLDKSSPRPQTVGRRNWLGAHAGGPSVDRSGPSASPRSVLRRGPRLADREGIVEGISIHEIVKASAELRCPRAGRPVHQRESDVARVEGRRPMSRA